MNINLLIDNIVRQTTLLVAQLATAAGVRTPLAHVAGQVFLDLVRELKAQGLGNKLIADMFGLSLRTYHDRVRRLSESATDRGATLWEAILNHVRSNGPISRAELLRRFHADDEASVRAVLKDLVGTGLLFKSGRADTTTFRAATAEEFDAIRKDSAAGTADWVWVSLHNLGPASVAELATQTGIESGVVRDSLLFLERDGHVAYDAAYDTYRTEQCIIPFGAEHGWEAAVFDHYQALVTAVAHKLNRGPDRARRGDVIGGSTYHFDLYSGHPKEREVLGLLEAIRDRAGRLREEVDAVSAQPGSDGYRVVFYAGQNVITDGESPTKEQQP